MANIRVTKIHLLWLTACFAVAGVAWAAGPAGTVTTATSQPTSQPSKFTVATYNVNFGINDRAGFADVVAVIRQSKADVVAIQEGSDGLRAYLKTELGKEYPHMQFYSGPAAGGFGWLSKYPLLSLKVLPRKFGWFNTPMAQIRIGGRTVQLVSAHLMPTIPPASGKMMDMMKACEQMEAVRAKEIRYIWSAVPAKVPTILMGDLNSLSSFNATTYLASQGMTDSFASGNADADRTASWHWKTASGSEWRFRLDYVWHNANFKTAGSRIIQAGPSDHYPVVSELELLPSPATQAASGPVTRK